MTPDPTSAPNASDQPPAQPSPAGDPVPRAGEQLFAAGDQVLHTGEQPPGRPSHAGDQPTIRLFQAGDWPAVREIVLDVVRARETFPFDPAMTEDDARAIWIERPPGRTVVAVSAGEVAGTAKLGPNRGGPGAHIATASFMVAVPARGRGIGAALCRHVIGWARQAGYAGIQFNAVVETNTTAVDLYRRHGFQVIGTVPRAFDHPAHGRVGLHLMYLEF